MSREWQITETQLYDVNTLLQRSDNVLVNLFVTRTAQNPSSFLSCRTSTCA